MSPVELLAWFAPYQFSWLAATLFPLAALLYAAGLKSARAEGGETGFWRPFAFFAGITLCYIVMHTRFDYYGQFLFFMHRAQHLVLHHTGALLIALGNPLRYWKKALAFPGSPAAQRAVGLLIRALAIPARVLQHPVIGSFIFVGLIYFWLTPSVHFDAMLSHPLYLLMNWSMLIDGLLFWLVLVDPRPPREAGTPGYRTRFLMILFTAVPQIVLGAYITFSRQNLYTVYSVCGRAWPISPKIDQLYGGLLTWIPPAMMEVLAALIVLSLLLRREREAGAAMSRSDGGN